MTISKTKSSFYRRLYVAYLIDSGTASVPEIMAATGMPRRTAQDTIAALEELDIVCEFEQREGARNHQGGYVIRDWGRYGGSGWSSSIGESRRRWSIRRNEPRAGGHRHIKKEGLKLPPSRACVLQMPRCSRVAWRARWASSSAGWTLLPAVGGGAGICGLR